MYYKLKNGHVFGTVLDKDGRTVLGGSKFVQDGSIVESLSVGALDMLLVKYTDNDGIPYYGWLFWGDVMAAPQCVRILYDITEADLLGCSGSHDVIVLHEGAVVEVSKDNALANPQWPIAVHMPDHSDYWYLRPDMYELVEE